MNVHPMTTRVADSLVLLLHACAGRAHLKGRVLDGNAATYEASYDTALDITWLADMNYMRTLYRASGGTKGTVDGLMQGYALVPYLDEIHGVDGWRLPSSFPAHGPSFDFTISNNGSTDAGTARPDIGWGTASELGHLFYVTQSNQGYCARYDAAPEDCIQQAGWQPQNTGPFVNMQPGAYWALNPPSPLDGYGHWRINLGTDRLRPMPCPTRALPGSNWAATSEEAPPPT